MRIGKPISEPYVESAPIIAPTFRPERLGKPAAPARSKPHPQHVEEGEGVPKREPVPVKVANHVPA